MGVIRVAELLPTGASSLVEPAARGNPAGGASRRSRAGALHWLGLRALQERLTHRRAALPLRVVSG